MDAFRSCACRVSTLQTLTAPSGLVWLFVVVVTGIISHIDFLIASSNDTARLQISFPNKKPRSIEQGFPHTRTSHSYPLSRMERGLGGEVLPTLPHTSPSL